jgi:predicted nuclease with TOPRIM domain
MTVNGKKNAIRKLLQEIESKAPQMVDEFKSFKFSSEVEEFESQLEAFKDKLSEMKGTQAQQEEILTVVEESLDSDDEPKPLSAEQQAAFLASLCE